MDDEYSTGELTTITSFLARIVPKSSYYTMMV
jgi:hypothetical protein